MDISGDESIVQNLITIVKWNITFTINKLDVRKKFKQAIDRKFNYAMCRP